MSRWHPSMGTEPPRDCRVLCDDGKIVRVGHLTYDEAVELAACCDDDRELHGSCRSHIVEMYAGWVPIAASRAVP